MKIVQESKKELAKLLLEKQLYYYQDYNKH